MAKKIQKIIKLHIQAGKATPAPPIGPALAQHGVNIAGFCSQFNEATKDKMGFTIPVEVTVYEDRSFDFRLKTPVTSELIKKAVGIEKGSGEPNKRKVGKISQDQLKEIAKVKLPDLNTQDLTQASKIIEGTAKGLGLEVK
ncbi:MAG: 50S ribosomal protein L11 [Candidatus Pacebacteria bacterium]|nr:50S ribosomal protein L11 [Candidatus Paceibacterota bacterium]